MLTVACETKTTGKRVAIPEKMETSPITGGAVAETPYTGETGKTAAEALRELQSMEGIQAISEPGQKSGTFYPPITTEATGKEALAAKTDALMRQSAPFTLNVEADKDFGSKYHDGDGDLKNLPGEYEDNEGD